VSLGSSICLSVGVSCCRHHVSSPAIMEEPNASSFLQFPKVRTNCRTIGRNLLEHKICVMIFSLSFTKTFCSAKNSARYLKFT
jgi:hypothetical protein